MLFRSFLVSMLIGFILDQMLYTTIYYLPDIIMSNLTVIDFLKTLTSNFIVTLLSSIILLIFVPILNIKNKNNKLKFIIFGFRLYFPAS